MRPHLQKQKKSWWLILLAIPFVVLLFPSLYNFTDPTLMGIPFFYWFQLSWVVIVSLMLAVFYWIRGD